MTVQPRRQLSIVVACPGCRTEGQVRFAQLPHVMHCPTCSVRFWIDRKGKVQSEDRVARVRFVCPRCGHRERLPVEFLGNGVKCAGCGGRFDMAADARFVAATERHAARRREHAQPSRRTTHTSGAMSGVRAAGVVGIGGVLLVALVVVCGTGSGVSVCTAATRFTRHCTSTDLAEARAWVLPGHETIFERWHALSFPQWHNPLAAPGSRLEVAVHDVDIRERTARVRLVVRERGGGGRMLTQYWRRVAEKWRFDPSRTLDAILSEGD